MNKHLLAGRFICVARGALPDAVETIIVSAALLCCDATLPECYPQLLLYTSSFIVQGKICSVHRLTDSSGQPL